MRRLYGMTAFAAMALGASLVSAQVPNQKDDPPAKDKVGLITNAPKAFQGYTLFSPGRQKNTFLIDMQGRAVKIWNCDREPGIAYLLPNGNLLRSGKTTRKLPFNPPPGLAGRIQEYTWEGELVWDYELVNDNQAQHHDICALPNGNVLCVAWDRRSAKEVLDAGRVETLAGDMLPDSVIELKKTGKTTAEIVWEWRAFDHLIQDYDETKSNYGEVAAHPELININFGSGALATLPATKEELQKIKNKDGGKKIPNVLDWTHVNAIAYNADLDQIIVSVHEFSEFWVIDHSTTTAEAKSHKGGKSGKGGDLLYRWGNPAAYRAGKPADQQLFVQHNAHWIPNGLPGAGHILVFNNGTRRPGGNYTSIDEIAPSLGEDGQYLLKPGTAFGPEKAMWSYTAPKKTDFYAYFISSAQRLANGNTFICAGHVGKFFEVTLQNEVVWEYINPIGPADGKAKDKGGKGGISGTTVFRAYRVGLDHPGLAGRKLAPGKSLEDMNAVQDSKVGLLQAQPEEGAGPLFAYVGTFSSPLRDVLPTQVDLPPGNGRGIHLFQVNRATGAMTPAGVHEMGTSPSCLALNTAGNRLYSANETDRVGESKEGTVSAFAINRADGQLKLLNTVRSGGAGPTFVSVHPSERFLLVANYFGGSVAVLPIFADGRLGAATDIKNDAGKIGPAKATNAPPGSFAFSGHDRTHAHMIQADPSGRFVLHVDLGLDKIFVWKFDDQKGVLAASELPSVSLPPGDGPRHFHFHPNGRWFYSIQEEGSTIVLFDFDAATGRLTSRQTISTLPPGFAGSNFCSGIMVSADGQFVYAGNRLHDSIGIFSIGANGTLKHFGDEWTRGNYPRSFSFDPTGQFLYCCNQRGDNVAVFRVDRKTGGLNFTGHYTPVGNPSIIVFLDLAKKR